jgi:lysophospholipase L1-like esterase
LINSDEEKGDLENEILAQTIAIDSSKQASQDTVKLKSLVNSDSLIDEVATFPSVIKADSALNDSTQHRILLLGDSEAGGIKNVLNDYCQSNGHKLVATIEWYSATSVNFAKGDTISKLIARYKPTYIFVLFGLNEVLARDAANRRAMARLFHKRLRKVPYAWIGPTNWGQDFVVTDAFRAAADSAAFFSSKSLVLPKASDGRHPSLSGYRIWMANIANWLQTSARWKMKMMPPARVGYPRKFRTIVFNAAEFRGY